MRRRRFLWVALATPGVLWLLLLFVFPFYVVLSLAFGTLDPLFLSPVPIWNPMHWIPDQFTYVLSHLAGAAGFYGPAILRTFAYVFIASVGCLLIAYPVAYYVSRFGGKRKGMLLVLLIAPFWISYMMRMLAWVNLLQIDGWINKVLSFGGIFNVHIAWLDGRPSTVILGLIYGYIPYMILPLYAGLDRIENSLLEAARDLGASRLSTFRRVTLPMSKSAVVASLLLVTLPMVGDYFTNDLLSASPSTAMFGNLINTAIEADSQVGKGAALLIIMFVVLLAPMLYYVRMTEKAEGGAV
ncbi:MAG: ABC transporter permease [Actinomycetes bacterium]